MSTLKEAEIRVKVLAEEMTLLQERIDTAWEMVESLRESKGYTRVEMVVTKANALVESNGTKARLGSIKALMDWHKETFGGTLGLSEARDEIYLAIDRYTARAEWSGEEKTI